MRRARFRRWRVAIGLALVCYWAVLFAATHVPVPATPGGLPPHSDKVVHFVAYAGLAFLLGLWLSLRRRLTARHYAFLFALTSLYGAADELLQIPVGRHCDLYDWLADCAGSLAGLAVLFAVMRPVGRRQPAPVATPAEQRVDGL